MGLAWSKHEDHAFLSNQHPPVPHTSTNRPHHTSFPNPKTPDIPHEKQLAKRQIEVYYRDFFNLYLNRTREMARIDSAAHLGQIDESTRLQLRKEQFMRELDYIRKKRNPVTMADYEIIRKIGQGSFGQVFLVRHRLDHCLYAMKKLQKKEMIYERQVNHVWLERFVLASVGEHPLVVKMHYSFQDRDHLYFIMEYLHGGDMMTMLIRNDFLPEHWVKFYIAELAVAIDALHRTGIIHRDIKPDNILFRKNGHICLSDFGLSKSLIHPPDLQRFSSSAADYVNTPNYIEHIRRGDVDLTLDERVRFWKDLARQNAFSQVGTPNYIAPEVLQDRSYSESCDWWSVGVILFEMLLGYHPFCSRSPAHVTFMICQWRNYLHFPAEIPETRLSKDAKHLITSLICEAPYRLGAKRGLAEFKEHSFFKGIDWDNLSQAQAPFIPELNSETDTRYFEDDITSTVISQAVSPPDLTRDELQSNATSASSGSGGRDDSNSNSSNNNNISNKALGPSKPRYPKRVTYNPNSDLEFVGFTFIPMRSDHNERWGNQHDLYNPPSVNRVEQKASPVTDALSLEVDPAASRVTPLRSPRGPLAKATIAAAEVTSKSGDATPQISPQASSARVVAVTPSPTGTTAVIPEGCSQMPVRFRDNTRAESEPRRISDQTVLPVISDVSSSASSELRITSDIQPVESGSIKVLMNGRESSNQYDDELDDGMLGAVRVTEVDLGRQKRLLKSERSDRDTKPRNVLLADDQNRSLHSSLSLPELIEAVKRVEEGSTEEPMELQRRFSDVDHISSGSEPGDESRVIRRMSRLHRLDDIPVFNEQRAPPKEHVVSKVALPIHPSSSEVDLFVARASRAMNNAARELTNTPSSNVSTVVRNAKEELNGTAAKIQESLAPV